MRWLVDLVAAAMLLALTGGVVLHHRAVSREREAIVAVRDDVLRIERELRRRAATGEVEVNGRGWPIEIDPRWFGQDPPTNGLLPSDRPWIEIAPDADAALLHPVVRQSYSKAIAAFWYNPALGIVRARAPVTISDQRATELYNEINGVALTSIFEGLPKLSRAGAGETPTDADTDAAALAGADLEEKDLDPTKPRPEPH